MASFSVITNLASVNAQSNLYSTNIGLRTALTRVSSGFRINYSGDDAAGLAVANAYRSDLAVLNQGVRNANDGLSNLQIKDGALDNVSQAARPPLDAGHAVGFGPDLVGVARHAEPGVRGRPQRNHP